MTCLAVLEGILRLFPQLALKFYWVKTCFFWHLWHYKLHWNYLIDQSCQNQSFWWLQEAHKEYNSLTDQIWAKYKQLDSGGFGSPGTPAFDAEACELANLLAHVSQLCTKLNLPTPKELYRPMFFKHWRHFSDLNWYTRQAVWLGYGGCSFVCRYVRITGLLSTPLVLRIGDWLCVLPAITFVVWQVQES